MQQYREHFATCSFGSFPGCTTRWVRVFRFALQGGLGFSGLHYKVVSGFPGRHKLAGVAGTTSGTSPRRCGSSIWTTRPRPLWPGTWSDSSRTWRRSEEKLGNSKDTERSQGVLIVQLEREGFTGFLEKNSSDIDFFVVIFTHC